MRSSSVRFRLLAVASLLVAFHGTATAHDFVEDEIVVVLCPGCDIEAVNQRWGTTTLDAYSEGDLYLISVPEGWIESDFSDLIELNDPDVIEAESNYVEDTPEGIREMVLSATGGTFADYIDQTAADRVGLDLAHETTRGAGVTVAVLDTGIDFTHQVFANNMHPDAWDFVDDDADPQESANGIDDDADGLTDEGFGHGSMVAGIIALVAPDATIMPLRVLDDEGRGEAFTVAKAIRYAEIHGAQVINMSLGGPNEVDAVSMQFDIIEQSQLTIVSGAGNENLPEPAYFPGNDSHVIMVTALDEFDVKASFADYNQGEVLVAAPGDGIRSAYPPDGWAIGAGCSFAVPFVTGEAVLIKSIAPGLDRSGVRNIIEQAVDDIYALPGNQPYLDALGSGRIYIPAAIDLATAWAASVALDPSPSLDMRAIRARPYPAFGSVVLELPGSVSAADGLRLDLYDASGRAVRTLRVNGPELEWDGRDARGQVVPHGLYFARLLGPGVSAAPGRVMILR